MEDDFAIGLDLGTTFSCIGVYRKGGVEIIPNSISEKLTPSIVIFKDDEILVGEDTTDFLFKYYDNCIYEVKRLIGLDFSKNDYEEVVKKLPFKIIMPREPHKQADIEVVINNEKKIYSPTEIYSLLIKKMVHNAENYLHKRIKKLVITVPAYFSENQRKLTSQAAEMLNLDVIKIINEPTAAALAYGFTEAQSKDKYILVFHLGGGTFDVSILLFKSEKDNKENLNSKDLSILSIAGDMHLGGEDFDNALVDYVIHKQNLDKDMIRKNYRAIKRLKIACENAKKNLSLSDRTILTINNLLDEVDINVAITKKEFESICQPLFERLKIPLLTAISEAHKKMKILKKDFSKDNIDEVILVGGSTKIPKVKEFVKSFFPNKKINDTINPDEVIAYGATLQAEKILYNHDKIISNFNILDIVPLSLGIAKKNESKDEELQKEGDEMNVIIKRGTPLPTFNIQNYVMTTDNKNRVSFEIYEGEKKYVKYNHLLKKVIITGLSSKPNGEAKISVEFKIDVNGILYVKAIEESEKNGKQIELTIKNDDISFSNGEMEKIKKKIEEMSKNLEYKELTKGIDCLNLKAALKMFKVAYNKCLEDDEDNKILCLNNYNETLEKFIDGFGEIFDNETLLEKYYLYIKELFLSYLEILKYALDRSEQKAIFKRIEKYIKIFTDKSLGYLDSLIEILSKLQNNRKNKIFFYNLIIFVMEILNNLGKECIQNNKEFSKYHSLMYFEQSNSYFEKYLKNIDENRLDRKNLESLRTQKKICMDYINDIKSGGIILIEEALVKGRMFDAKTGGYESLNTGFTKDMNRLNINLAKKEEELILMLDEYEKIFSSILIIEETVGIGISEKEALCIANILKINDLLGKIRKKYQYLINLSDRCEFIIERLKNVKDKQWCQEFLKIKNKIEALKIPEQSYDGLFQKVRKENPQIFDEIEQEFKKGKNRFIDFITTKYPYKNIENDKKERNFKEYNTDFAYFLSKKYTPGNYMKGNKKSELDHCIKHEISSKLCNLITNF